VVGTAFGTSVVAFLERDTGVVVSSWQTAPHTPFVSCAVIDERLYVAGSRELPSKVFVFNDLVSVDVIDLDLSPIASDGVYLYGTRFSWDNRSIEVVKLTPDFVKVGHRRVTLTGNVYPFDIGINPVSGDVWIVGSYRASVFDEWRPLVVILDGDLKLKKVFEFSVGGSGGVAKFDVAGELVVERRGVAIKKLACVGDYVYGFGDSSGGHTLYVFDDNLNLVDRVDLGTPNGVFGVGRPAFDGVYVYVAGYDRVGNTEMWVVYAIEATKQPAATQPTAVFA